MTATAEVTPYLMFGGRCEEALKFYQTALGAKLEMMMRFNESPDPVPDGMLEAGFKNKVMHASLLIENARLMASDGCNSSTDFKGFSLSIAFDREEKVDAVFNALAAEGSVTMPLGQTFWSKRFGMVIDKFGVNWMVTVRE